jgi:hypothetical protein
MTSSFNPHLFAPDNWVSRRRALVSNWAQVLKVIENSYDPNYDPASPQNMPTNCIIPPEGLLCGADPQAVQDPKARAVYAAELQENEAKKKRFSQYQRLGYVDGLAMAALEGELKLLGIIAPAGTPSDAAALDGILRKVGLNDARRNQLDPYFTGSGP